jgi:hypothetical protein
MRHKLAVGLTVVLTLVFLVTIMATAQQKASGHKLLCVSNQQLKGEQTVSSCLVSGERFAVVDQLGIVHVLTPEEVELTKAFNPKIFESRAFGVQYHKEAPSIPPLPVSPEIQ